MYKYLNLTRLAVTFNMYFKLSACEGIVSGK